MHSNTLVPIRMEQDDGITTSSVIVPHADGDITVQVLLEAVLY